MTLSSGRSFYLQAGTADSMRHTTTMFAFHVLLAAPGWAAANGADGVLRPRAGLVRTLLAQGEARSPTFRALVARLECSDLIVYIDVDVFGRHAMHGALNFVTARGGRRYVRISIDGDDDRPALIAWLGHELQHAVELAEHPEITSVDRLAAYYATHEMIGSADHYESVAAVEVRLRIVRELSRSK